MNMSFCSYANPHQRQHATSPIRCLLRMGRSRVQRSSGSLQDCRHWRSRRCGRIRDDDSGPARDLVGDLDYIFHYRASILRIPGRLL